VPKHLARMSDKGVKMCSRESETRQNIWKFQAQMGE